MGLEPENTASEHAAAASTFEGWQDLFVASVNRDFFMTTGPFCIRNFQLPVDRFHRSRSDAIAVIVIVLLFGVAVNFWLSKIGNGYRDEILKSSVGRRSVIAIPHSRFRLVLSERDCWFRSRISPSLPHATPIHKA